VRIAVVSVGSCLVYPLPEDTPALNDYYNFTNVYKNESYISISSYLLAPLTLGNISINSTDPSANPIINLPVSQDTRCKLDLLTLQFYEDQADMNIHVLTLKRLRTLIAQPQFLSVWSFVRLV